MCSTPVQAVFCSIIIIISIIHCSADVYIHVHLFQVHMFLSSHEQLYIILGCPVLLCLVV